MSRPRERVCLQDGVKLDLNQLARKGFIKPGANIGVRGITWTHSYWGEIANGLITTDMRAASMRNGFESRLATLPSGSYFPRDRAILAGTNGILFARLRIDSLRCCGNQLAQRGFAAGRPGASKSPISRNLTTRQAGRMLERRGSRIG